MLFFRGSNISKDFPIAEDLSENPADTGIISKCLKTWRSVK